MTERRAFSVAVFARHGDEILLIAHKRLGTWLPPGGEIEEGETPLEAARRELKEETGLEGRFELLLGVDGTPPGFLGYEEHQAGVKGLHMNFVFVADVDSKDVKANAEFSEYMFTKDADRIECPRNVRELFRLAMRAGRASEDSDEAPSDLEALARVWVAAFNARDLERLLRLYAEDALHTSPKLRARDPSTRGEIRGKPALRGWWADSMARLPGLHYALRHVAAGAGRVVIEYERKNPGQESSMVAEVFVVEGGLIRASHVYHG